MIKEVVELLITSMTPLLSGINIDLPESNELDTSNFKDSNFPVLIMQGPTIEKNYVSYEQKDVYIEDNIHGVKKYGKYLAENIVNISFRLRYFNKRLVDTVRDIEKLEQLSITLCSLMYDSNSYNVEFGAGFDSDTVPNFSNLKHYENRCVIEALPITKAQADKEVYELKTYDFVFNKK